MASKETKDELGLGSKKTMLEKFNLINTLLILQFYSIKKAA